MIATQTTKSPAAALSLGANDHAVKVQQGNAPSPGDAETVPMPRELAVRLLLDDCDRMLDLIDARASWRRYSMLEWIGSVYCAGMMTARAAALETWALEVFEIGGPELVWIELRRG